MTARRYGLTSPPPSPPICTLTSTAPMGADPDPTAVVDAWGKVRGGEALRVVDASILPEIPSVATNVTTIMVAERIAAKLSARAGAPPTRPEDAARELRASADVTPAA